MDRRSALSCICCAGVGLTQLLIGRLADAEDLDQIPDKLAADRWMREWIGFARVENPESIKAANGAMYLGRFADPMYYLASVIGWDPNPAQVNSYEPVRVPIGFVTDFASIPRAFWSALRPDGLYAYPAVIHDYLYWEQYLSREKSDEIFKYCMEDFRVSPSVITAVYTAVRHGGGAAWRENARLKAAGEKRLLKKTPANPTIRWEDWKLQPDVFV